MHPDIFTVSEPWLALHPVFALRQSGVATDYNHSLAQTATMDFLRLLPGGEESYFEGVRRMLDYLYKCALSGTQKRFFLDKTPRYYFVLSELRRVFPEARFVFVIRNPIAVLASILDTWLSRDSYAADILWDFRFDLLEAPKLIGGELQRLNDEAIKVHYEDLVNAPEVVIRGLCEALDLVYEEKMTDYGLAKAGSAERWAYGDQTTVYAETRPVADRVNRWQGLFTRSEQSRGLALGYLTALGPELIAALGYDFDYIERILLTGCNTTDSAEERSNDASQVDMPDLTRVRSFRQTAAEQLNAMREMHVSESLLAQSHQQTGRQAAVIQEQISHIEHLKAVVSEGLGVIEQKEKRVGLLEAQIRPLEAEITEKEARVSQQRALIQAQSSRINSLEVSVEKHQAALYENEARLAQQSAEIDSLRREGLLAYCARRYFAGRKPRH